MLPSCSTVVRFHRDERGQSMHHIATMTLTKSCSSLDLLMLGLLMRGLLILSLLMLGLRMHCLLIRGLLILGLLMLGLLMPGLLTLADDWLACGRLADV